MARTFYVILNDGDTFAPLEGCKLVSVDDTKLDGESIQSLNNGNMAHFLEDNADNPGVDEYDLAPLIRVLF